MSDQKRPTIKMTIAQNGAVVSEMSNFKKCSQATESILKDLDMSADSITAKDEEVEVASVSAATVGAKG